MRDGLLVDEGSAAIVLGGPLTACRRVLDGLAADGSFRRGVGPGETWRSRITGLDLPGLTIAFP